jgi:hypothetical protein
VFHEVFSGEAPSAPQERASPSTIQRHTGTLLSLTLTLSPSLSPVILTAAERERQRERERERDKEGEREGARQRERVREREVRCGKTRPCTNRPPSHPTSLRTVREWQCEHKPMSLRTDCGRVGRVSACGLFTKSLGIGVPRSQERAPPPSRTATGPEALSYCRVLGGLSFL